MGQQSGFFSSLKKEAALIGRDISRGVDDVSKSINDYRWYPILDQFKTGNVVQLISVSSGKALQIVMSPHGQLVVDGLGPEDPHAYHAHWTVFNEGKNVVHLHNNNNYLAIKNGTSYVQPSVPGNPGPEARFKVSVHSSNFLVFESCLEPNKRIGILSSGELKPALATGTEKDAHFGVRLVFSPEPVASAPTQPGQVPPGQAPPGQVPQGQASAGQAPQVQVPAAGAKGGPVIIRTTTTTTTKK